MSKESTSSLPELEPHQPEDSLSIEEASTTNVYDSAPSKKKIRNQMNEDENAQIDGDDHHFRSPEEDTGQQQPIHSLNQNMNPNPYHFQENMYMAGHNQQSHFAPLDPILQVQYYQDRMRDHAAAYAQYASAAAGAALAAAQIASTGTFYPSLPHPMNFYPNTNNQSNSFGNSIGAVPNAFTFQPPEHGHPPHFQSQVQVNQIANIQNHNTHQRSMENMHSKKQKRFPTYTSPHEDESNSQSSMYHKSRRRRPHFQNNYNQSPSRHNQQMNREGKKAKRVSGKSLELEGRTGVSALTDLCQKRHWSPPKFVATEISNCNQANDTSSSVSSGYMNGYVGFSTSVQVNNVILARGKGGSKKSAQQDAARKAISVLYPGTVFDANGILLDLGSTDKSSLIFENCSTKVNKKKDNVIRNSLKDLEENMAERFSIGVDEVIDRGSPAPSEDSSISTAVSIKRRKNASTTVVTGGPLIQHKDRPKNRLSFPSASTTSGFSSASEDVDDDEFLQSSGAHICSVLLNVMVQIDSRIKEQPSYTYDTCENPVNVAQQIKHEKDQLGKGDKVKFSSSKRKGAGYGALMSKRRTATSMTGKTVTIHRSSFVCTASLRLHENVTDNAERVALGETKSASSQKDSIFEGKDLTNFAIKTLQAIGTGSTKRESRHIASAKLLAKLFPHCKNMVEVKLAAEAAREKYAASKSKLKRRAQTEGDKKAKREKYKCEPQIHYTNDYIDLLFSKATDPIPRSNMLRVGKGDSKKKRVSVSSADDLAKLSLSDSTDFTDNENSPRIFESPSKKSELCTDNRRKLFEELIERSLQQVNEAVDEKKLSYLKEEDLSKTVLRRANIGDIQYIDKLRSKSSNTPIYSPKSLPQSSSKVAESALDLLSAVNDPFGDNSVVLMLSRAIASSDEPPLGYAVLTRTFSLQKGNVLVVSEFENEVHFPRERLVECLEEFGETMKCKVEVESPKSNSRNNIFLTETQLKKMVQSYVNPSKMSQFSHGKKSKFDESSKQFQSRKLQSVKEVENEDEDIKNDQHKKRLKLN